MSINILVISTANQTRRFTQDNNEHINHLLDGLKRSAHIFTDKPLIIGSAAQTDLFSSSSIACIELETSTDLSGYLPGMPDMTITALTAQEAMASFTGGLDGEHYKARIDFYFQGGHVLNTVVEGERKAALAERLMNQTRIFERPVITYRLPQGGIGIMNPQTIIRFVVTPGIPDLPRDAWLANPA